MHGDARAAIEPERAAADLAVVPVGEKLRRASAERRLVVDLVLVRDVVDQPGADGVFRQEGTVVDERAHLVSRLVPRLGEPLHELFVEIAIQGFGHFTVRGREGPLRVGVAGRLVVADVQHLRIRADLVQRAAKEQFVRRHAGQVERRGRHQEDLVAGAREIELLLGPLLEVRHDRLAGRAEVDDRVADLLHLGPQRRRAARPDDDRRHTVIDLGLSQGLGHGANGRRRLQQLTDDPAGFRLLEVPRHFHQQHGIAGHLRAAADQQGRKHQPGRRYDDGHEQQRHNQPDASTHSHDLPPLRTPGRSSIAARFATCGPARLTGNRVLRLRVLIVCFGKARGAPLRHGPEMAACRAAQVHELGGDEGGTDLGALARRTGLFRRERVHDLRHTDFGESHTRPAGAICRRALGYRAGHACVGNDTEC